MRCPQLTTGRHLLVCLAFAVHTPAGARAFEDVDPSPETKGDSPQRVRSGLLVLYDFGSNSGPIVSDRSGVGTPVNLRIADPGSIRRAEGSLEVRKATVIRSENPPTRVAEAVQRSGEITIEAWIRPAKTGQEGPARIVTFSRHATERNFTLGQDNDKYDVRFRTSRTNSNGIPSVSSPAKSLTPNVTHVVYTRDRGGQTRLFLNGKQAASKKVAGNLNPWNGRHSLALANELTGDRAWLGTYFLVALYSRDLSPAEVEKNFKAGPGVQVARQLAQNQKARFFQQQIAPLLSNHCLECHDPASRKGGLDLSTQATALQGGESGPVLVPGKSADSRLLELATSGDMPKKRPPLSRTEQAALKKWIDDGAVWSLRTIDPVIFAHDGRAGKNWVRRLTVPEYIETVRAAVGVDIAKEAREILPPDLRADGFSNTAYNLNIDLKHVDAYAKLAEIIVRRMDVNAFTRKYSRSRRLIDDDNRELISRMGKWLLRGPLQEHEVVAYRGIATTVASAGGGFEEAMSYIIEAMLQSPRFIYRIENQRGDGTAWPVNEHELASRLSYIVWGGPPDEELMKAADAGSLDRSGVEKQVERMLKDRRATAHSRRFVSEWLNLNRLDNMQPSAKKFPHWKPVLAADMKAETLEFFEDVVWKQQRPLSALLNAQVTYATPALAEHYGLSPEPESENKRTRYDVSSVPGRGGILTQGSVLTVGGDEASMVSRGLFVLHDLLRGVVKDPPPCVDTTPVPTKAGLTQRGIAEARIANVNCGGCHGRFEPLAFGLEKFDGLGAWHEKDEHGNRLRDDGEILFPGSAKPVKYQSSAELMNLLAGSERVKESITWKVAQFSLGRPLVAEDAPILDKIYKSAQTGGGTWSSLMKAIVTSELVLMTRTEPFDSP